MTTDREVPRASTPEVVLRQEQVRVGTAAFATRAVVRRHVVTEVQVLEVTVRREVLEVEQEPVEPQAVGGPHPAGTPALPQPLVVVLSEEVPVVHLETRPYERVTLEVHTVTEQQEIAAEVSGERVDISTPQPPAG